MKLELEKHMAKRRMGIAKLALKSELSETYIRELLDGKKSPTLRSVAKLAKALDTTPKQLLPRRWEEE